MNDFQKELCTSLRRFCESSIEPHMEHDDHEGKFRMEIFQGLGDYGVTGVTLPEEFGGAGLSYLDYAYVLEEIAKASVPYAVTVSVSGMVQTILKEFGNNSQKQKYLPALTSGKEIGAFALSESHAGSDAGGLKTTAKKVDGGYLLNGTKMWITSGGIASTYIVMARTGGEGAKGVSAFIVKDGSEGFSFGKAERKMGWKTSPTRELVFENCFIPTENLLMEEGQGFKVAMGGLDRGRMAIGAISVGCAQRTLDEAIKYSLTRKQFDQAIFDFQGLQFMISDMATETMSARLLVHAAAASIDSGKTNSKLCSMAKLKASDVAMEVTTNAVQVLGGVGYTSEYPVERFMRDAKVLQIVEGTNQIQRVVIARHLKKEYEHHA
ncbi:MAG TPA: acyl-CoA dehydrogenase family protein [Bacteriovoracaceae bacterium]|nr:acyl-CoA dehydrogenase family protein [Bacteriovoracaceae bacterium]